MTKEKSTTGTNSNSPQIHANSILHKQEGASHNIMNLHNHKLPKVPKFQPKTERVPRRIPENGSKDINECAEDFINRFRQNLQLQRLESIENYKQMLARGV